LVDSAAPWYRHYPLNSRPLLTQTHQFVVGAGLSTLETGADNFLAICGPPRYSEIRLNLAQGVQGVGSFVAPLLASRVFFAKSVFDTQQGLKNVQWVYLGVACFVALLIILFWLAPMPEVTDADMHAQEEEIETEQGRDVGPFWKQWNLFLGVWSQFVSRADFVDLARD
jgi:MFS transporter, FHS family, L-fucose permease